MATRMKSGLLATAVFAASACAQGGGETSLNRAEIEEIVHEYILENPEIIEEALIRLSQQADAREAEAVRENIRANYDAIYNSEDDYAIGPEDAAVTVVEFFDYRCSFCKRSLDWTMALPEDYEGKVRVVFKDLPILSPESEKAALAALAAGQQGKYTEMHLELMELDNSTGFDPEDIDAAAERAGVDVAQMREDMDSVRLKKIIADNKSLARKLNVDGTPAFFIGEAVVPGANREMVNNLIRDELSKDS